MTRFRTWLAASSFVSGVLILPGCDADGVGDPCVPEDEYSDTFSGFAVSEVSSESRSFQCQSRLCLVNHFQGRVSCPYGQAAEGGACKLPGGSEPVRSVVKPQLLDRRAEAAVYCSCRCDGPDPTARYCQCPSGFSCSAVVPDFALGAEQLPGSYCIREGSQYSRVRVGTSTCDAALSNCDE